MKNRGNTSLIEGNILEGILNMAWPILLANLFQEVYNITNSMIVGNYVSTIALGAVSATGPILNILNYIFHGFATGTGIVVARLYGANNKEDLRKSVGTIVVFAAMTGLLFTLIMEVFTPLLLNINNIQSDIYASCATYLRVYSLGSAAVLMYTMLFYLLRAIGDSRHPLYYLIASCLLNIVLGMFFTLVLHMEIAGVALATILSELVVDVLCLRLLFRMEEFRIDFKTLRFDWSVCRQIVSIGIPAAVQNMLIAVSLMFLQQYINRYPVEAIAGIGVGNRVANWSQIPLQALSTSITTFVGQNIGADRFERVKDGVKQTVFIGTAVTAGMVAMIFILAKPLVSLFDRNPEVIRYGSEMTRYMVLSYIPLAWSHLYNASLRGAGNIRVPLIIAVLTQCIFRYLFVLVAYRFTDSILVIYLSGALCFTLAGCAAYAYYNYGEWTKENRMR